MRRISMSWSIAGFVFGGLGFAYNLMLLGVIINGALVAHGWLWLGILLCPWFIPFRNFWCVLTLNCFLYALVFVGSRLALIKLSRENLI